MYKFVAVDIGVSADELFHIYTGLSFREPFLDLLAEIALAKLSNDVGVVLGRVDFVQS